MTICGSDEIFRQELEIYKEYKNMTYTAITNSNNESPGQEEEDIMNADAGIYRELRTLFKEISLPEMMAIGLHAYWLSDATHTNLCELQPKHGDFPAKVKQAVELVRQLQPQSRAEVASEILLGDWGIDLTDDAPSTVIE